MPSPRSFDARTRWRRWAAGLGALALASCSSPAADRTTAAQGKATNPMTSPSSPSSSAALTVVADLSGSYGTRLALHGDGHRWALADGRSVQLGHDGTVERKLTAPAEIRDLAWSSDGKALYACPQLYDVTRDAWTTAPGLSEALLAGLDEPPDPDQLGIVAGAFAPEGGELVVTTRFQPSRAVGGDDSYRGPRERFLAIGADGKQRGVLAAGDDELRAVAVSQHFIAAGGATISLWDRKSLRKVQTLAHHKLTVRALAFSAGGDRLAAIAADGEVSLWDTATGRLVTAFAGHQGDGYSIAVHPRLPLLATGGMDGMLRLWTAQGKLVQEVAMDGWVQAVAFDPSGARVAAVARARPPHLTIFALSPPQP
jgi:WD40 repeat protein